MKLKWKLSLSLLAVTGSLFLLGGYWMIHQNFMSSMDDAARRYTASHASQLDLVTTFLARQDDPSPSQAGAEAAAGVPDGALALADAGYALLFSNLPEELDKMDLYDAVEAADTGFVYRQHGDRIWFLEASALPAQTDLHLISAFEVTALYTERTEQLHRFWRIAAVLLAAVALLTALVSGAVLRPLRRLQAAVQRIAGGVYDERTGFVSRDEVGSLSREFDRMAEAIEARDQALRESIRQRDDFVSAFTHEVKTPMTAMLGYASMLRTREVDLATRQKAADYIYHESKRLETLSRRLMALMRLGEEKLQLVPTPLSGILNDVRAAAAGLPGVRVLMPESGGLYVRADRSLAADLLWNLVENAAHAAPRDGCVRITVTEQPDRVELAVSDTGRGIPPEELPRIIEPFYMVDKSRSRSENGSGLGLALCNRIAELHGGSLHFESTLGEGTTVRFSLEKEAAPCDVQD